MPLTFDQTFLKPGRYHVGGGRFQDFTADDIRLSIESTNQMMADGNAVPVLLEHAPPGSDEGAPRDRKADGVRHGVGWLNRLDRLPDGSASHSLELTDGEIAKKAAEGSIRYTSPEFRKEWRDGRGRTYHNIISHIALTHKPRVAGQERLRAGSDGAATAYQFSLDDAIQFADGDEAPTNRPAVLRAVLQSMGVYLPDGLDVATLGLSEDDIDKLVASLSVLDEARRKANSEREAAAKAAGQPVAQMADDDNPFAGKDKKEGDDATDDKADPPAAPNPDSPPDAGAKQKDEAIVQNLDALGVVLPSDFDLGADGAKDILLAALKTAAKAKSEAASKEKPGDDGIPAEDAATGGMQFSLSDVEAKDFANPLLAKLIRNQHDTIRAKLNKLVETNRISSAFRDRLLGANVLQFSSEADELPTLTLGAFVDALNELPEGIALSADECLAEAHEVSHPGGSHFLGGPETEAEAEAAVDKLFRRKTA